ncbi:MAG: hypothetical protein A4S09_15920 [Proteobacteria bacterium SG_bin7]|nr:MAG: hypothetical protein A4S09_15920 [Proteobacteria bacterium SG_bin7]
MRFFLWSSFCVLTTVVITTACSKNLFIGFTDYSTDDALYSQAMTYLNSKNWDKAIAELQKTTSTFQARRQTRYIFASAYAGKCGLDTIALINEFDDIGSTRLFPFLLNIYKSGGATELTACKSAETQLRSISDNPTLRSAGENLLMVLIEFAKIGTIFAKNPVDADNNGTMDTFNGTAHCSTTNMIVDADANELITGLSQVILSLPYAGTTFGQTQLNFLTGACTALAGSPDPTYNFCGVINTTDVVANQRKGVRTLFGSNQGVGLGNCNGDLTTCLCP